MNIHFNVYLFLFSPFCITKWSIRKNYYVPLLCVHINKLRNCVTNFVDPIQPSLKQAHENLALEIGKRGKKLSIEGVPLSPPPNISPKLCAEVREGRRVGGWWGRETATPGCDGVVWFGKTRAFLVAGGGGQASSRLATAAVIICPTCLRAGPPHW